MHTDLSDLGNSSGEPFPSQVLPFVFYCCDKHIRKEGVYLAYTSQSQSIYEGSQDRNSSSSRGRNLDGTNFLKVLNLVYAFTFHTSSTLWVVPVLPSVLLGSGSFKELRPSDCIAVTRFNPNIATEALQGPCCASLLCQIRKYFKSHCLTAWPLACLRCDTFPLCLPSHLCCDSVTCDTPLATPFSTRCFFTITKRITWWLFVHSITLL